MIIITLHGTDGTKHPYKLPESAAEYSCKKVIEFQETVETLKPETLLKAEEIMSQPAETDELKEDRKKEHDEYIESLDPEELDTAWTSYYLKCIQFWTGIETDKLGLLPVYDPDGYDIFSLWTIIETGLKKVDDKDIESIDFFGETFVAPPMPVSMFDHTKKDALRGMKLGEYAVSHELFKAFSSMQGGQCKGMLHVLATVFRKEGEELPILPDEQMAFINKRVELFKNLDYQTALNAVFFFIKHRMNAGKDLAFLQAAFPKVQMSLHNMAIIQSFAALQKVASSINQE